MNSVLSGTIFGPISFDDLQETVKKHTNTKNKNILFVISLFWGVIFLLEISMVTRFNRLASNLLYIPFYYVRRIFIKSRRKRLFAVFCFARLYVVRDLLFIIFLWVTVSNAKTHLVDKTAKHINFMTKHQQNNFIRRKRS